MLHHVVWYNFNDVLEVLDASITRAISYSSTRVHGATFQKTAIFILESYIYSKNKYKKLTYILVLKFLPRIQKYSFFQTGKVTKMME
jgi:hypothetical protein